MEQPYISRSYKNALITVVLMAIGFGVYLSFEDPLGRKAITIIMGFTMLIAMITAVRGIIQFYKGRNGEKNSKFIIALIGNGLGILYLILTIITGIRFIPKVL